MDNEDSEHENDEDTNQSKSDICCSHTDIFLPKSHPHGGVDSQLLIVTSAKLIFPSPENSESDLSRKHNTHH